MTTDRESQVRKLVDEAIGFPTTAEREGFLKAACKEDPGLYAEVHALLEQSVETMGTDRPEHRDVDWISEQSIRTDTVIGSWHIRRLIGRGGMGEVYEAERADGTFELRAAVKVLKRGMDSEIVVKRFQRERRFLAQLAHPNIARPLDAGVAPDGRPYLVMDYVEGRPLTAYTADAGLKLTEILRLFLTVCDAVQAAHARGIVHRDLKPSNVLVTAEGQVKLLDFGIAKSVAEDDADSTRMAGDAVALTPAYAAPEQFHGKPVSPATDVYALGVMLFQLIVGRLPHDRENDSVAAIRQRVHSENVSRPSSLLKKERGRLPESQRTERLQSTSRDLDLIVLKALDAEPQRRYPEARDFADDLRNFLLHRPIGARADSVAYRTAKFLKRNRGPAIAIGSIILSLVAGLAVAAMQARDARKRQSELEQVVSFQSGLFKRVNLAALGELWASQAREQLITGLQRNDITEGHRQQLLSAFDEIRPSTASADVARQSLAGSVLEPAAREIDQRFLQQPELRSELLLGIAQTYDDLAIYPKSRQYVNEVLSFSPQALGEDANIVLNTRLLDSYLLLVEGKGDESLRTGQDVVRRRTRTNGEKSAETLNARLSLLYPMLDKGPSHEELLDIKKSTTSLVQDVRNASGIQRETVWEAEQMLSNIDDYLNDMDEALSLLDGVVADQKKTLGEESRAALRSDQLICLDLADGVSTFTFSPQRAVESCGKTIELEDRVIGDQALMTLETRKKYSDALLWSGRVEEARSAYKHEYEDAKAAQGKDSGVALSAAAGYIKTSAMLGHAVEVLPLADQLVKHSTPEDAVTAELLGARAETLAHLSRSAEAAIDYQSALKIAGMDPVTMFGIKQDRARLLVRGGHWTEAETELDALDRQIREELGPASLYLALDRMLLGEMKAGEGDYRAAVPLLAETLTRLEHQLGTENPAVLELRTSLARAKYEAGNHAEGCTDFDEALRRLAASQADVLEIEKARQALPECARRG